MDIFLLKAAVAAGCLLTLLCALRGLRYVRLETLQRWTPYDVGLLWLLTRLTPMVLIYVCANIAPQSDVATCFWPQASSAASAGVPYRDFESSFGPLFPYLLAAPLFLWSDPRALILWLSVLEAVVIAVTTKATGWDQPGLPRARFLLCAFLAPGPLLLSVIGGQEDFLLWGGGLAVWWALSASRPVLAGFLGASAILSTKAIFLFPLVGLLPVARSRLAYLAPLAGVGALAIAVLWRLTGTGFLGVLGQSNNISPPQIWILLHFLTQGMAPAGGQIIAFASVAVVLLTALAVATCRLQIVRTSLPGFAAYWVLIYALLMLLSAKSQGAYFGLFMFPCLVQAIKRCGSLLTWCLLGALVAIEPTLFYRLGKQLPSGLAAVADSWVLLDLLLQFTIVGMLAWFAWDAWRGLYNSRCVAIPAPRSN